MTAVLTAVPVRVWRVLGAVLVVAAGVVDYVRDGDAVQAIAAAVAAGIAVGAGWLALTLPGTSVRGSVIGGSFVAAGILTWTSTNRPIFIWAVLAFAGVAFAVWGRPWLRGLRELPRLGTAWTGLAYWPLGVVGALLVGHLTVGVQRAAYAGVFTLAALALIALVHNTGRDPSAGIAAAILVGIAVLLLAGSGSVFVSIHEVPAGSSAALMRDRFWGGLGLYYHPNSLAGLAVIPAIRIGLDRAFSLGQRLAVTGLAGLLLVLTNSRTGLVFAVAAALLHAVLVIRNRRADLPAYRRRWAAVLVPFVVIALVVVFSGGGGYLIRNRLNAPTTPNSTTTDRVDAAASGRLDTWRQVLTDWEHDGIAEKIFGDAKTSRAVVIRTNDGAPVDGPRRQLNTDNAAVGSFRRGGVLGALAFVLGVGLLLLHALRRRRDGTAPAAWVTVAAIAVIPTIATEDWMLGGTNGALWILLLAGEAYLVFRPRPGAPVQASPAAPAEPAVTAVPFIPASRK